ncbi:MAG: flagellar hook capping protein [Desulfobacteraceae bacterium]|nr:MAG: flagellar hook capping protein [Desulfobacteraceae bacterium]
MTVNATGSNYLNNISNTPSKTDQSDDPLGRDSFLTMLVAQLENQDPLNPMEGTDFSAQLAQFSQLEQLMNLNDTMLELKTSFDESTEGNVMEYVGKKVSVNMDEMEVLGGSVSGGSYTINEPSDIMVSITNDQGNLIRTLYLGGQTSGTHTINWDGKDSGGNIVADGTYNYTIMANTGSGFVEVPSTKTGIVEAVIYDNNKPYFIIDGVSIDANSLVALYKDEDTSPPASIADYLGKNISSNAPVVLLESGKVSGEELAFELDAPQDAVVQIYDHNDQLVKSIVLLSDETKEGTNLVEWDGTDQAGNPASDGLYYYTVETAESVIRPPVADLVSGIRYYNGLQYLVMNDSGRLVSPNSITSIN